MEKINLKYAVGSRAQGYMQAAKGFAHKISMIVISDDAVALDLAHDRAVRVADLRHSLRESSRADLVA